MNKEMSAIEAKRKAENDPEVKKAIDACIHSIEKFLEIFTS
jgi:cytidylate kinase